MSMVSQGRSILQSKFIHNEVFETKDRKLHGVSMTSEPISVKQITNEKSRMSQSCQKDKVKETRKPECGHESRFGRIEAYPSGSKSLE